jgi:general secretion pathway protein F
MPDFHYKAYTKTGDLAEGTLPARTRAEVDEVLWGRGLTVFDARVTTATANPANSKSLFRHRVSLTELAEFTRDLATLTDASVPIDRCLRIQAMPSARKSTTELAEGLLAEVLDGSTLSNAIAKRIDTFGGDFVHIVRAGEATGNVAGALRLMAETLERRKEVNARLSSALIYPMILIVMAIVSTAVVIAVLVPGIAPIFKENGQSMPAGLQMVLDAQAMWPLFLVSFVAIVLFVVVLRGVATRQPALRVWIDSTKLRVPLLGNFLMRQDLARFSRTLGSMLTADVPLLVSLSSARSVVVNRQLQSGIDHAIEAVRDGATLSRAIEDIDLMPTRLSRLVAVGEESGKCGPMLLRVALMFEQESMRLIERGLALVTPVLTVGIAVLVGGLVMTVMSALLSVNDIAVR